MESNNKIVEVITQGTYDIYKKYYMFSMFRGKMYKLGPILFYVINIVGILVVILSGTYSGFEAVDIIVLTILILMDLIMILLMFIIPKRYYRSAKNIIESTNKFRFTEEYMEVESTSELANDTSHIMYNALNRVCEIEDMIFIYLSNSQAYIIPKKDCTPENIQKLRTILNSKVKKYNNYSKKI